MGKFGDWKLEIDFVTVDGCLDSSVDPLVIKDFSEFSISQSQKSVQTHSGFA